MGAWDCTVRICSVVTAGFFAGKMESTECLVELSAPILDMQWDTEGEKIVVLIGSEKDNVLEFEFEGLVERRHDKKAESELDVAWKAGKSNVVGTHLGGTGLAVWDNRPAEEEVREVLPPLQDRREGRKVAGGGKREVGEFVLTVGINGELVIWQKLSVFKEQQSYQWTLLKRVRMTEIPADGYPTCIDIHKTSGLTAVGVGGQIRVALIDDLLSQETSAFSIIEDIKKASLFNCLKIRQRSAEMDDLEEDYSEILVVAGRADGRCNAIYISLENKKSIRLRSSTYKILEKDESNLCQVSGVGFCNLSFQVFFIISSEKQIIFWNVKKGLTVRELKVPDYRAPRWTRSFTAGDFSKDGNYFVGALGYDWSKGVENITFPATTVKILVLNFTKEMLVKEVD